MFNDTPAQSLHQLLGVRQKVFIIFLNGNNNKKCIRLKNTVQRAVQYKHITVIMI